MSYADSDNAILQQETETGTIHVSNFQLLLYCQPVGPGLLVELLTSGAEHHGDILADARDFDFDTYESSAVVSSSKLLLWFPSASPATRVTPFKNIT